MFKLQSNKLVDQLSKNIRSFTIAFNRMSMKNKGA